MTSRVRLLLGFMPKFEATVHDPSYTNNITIVCAGNTVAKTVISAIRASPPAENSTSEWLLQHRDHQAWLHCPTRMLSKNS